MYQEFTEGHSFSHIKAISHLSDIAVTNISESFNHKMAA